jgi:ribosome biogenesis SPOUT family RNA methylase Rps3
MEVVTVGGYLLVAVSGDVDPWALSVEFVLGEVDLQPRRSTPLCDPEQMGEIIERLKRDHHMSPDGAMRIAHDLCFGVELEE